MSLVTISFVSFSVLYFLQVVSLQGCISRSVLSTLNSMIESFPSESESGFLLPLMQDPDFGNGPQRISLSWKNIQTFTGSPQSDLITKLLGTFTSEGINLLWRYVPIHQELMEDIISCVGLHVKVLITIVHDMRALCTV